MTTQIVARCSNCRRVRALSEHNLTLIGWIKTALGWFCHLCARRRKQS